MAKSYLLSCVVLLLMCIIILEATPRTPNVQVYSRHPVELGKENIMNCYVDKFHPPKINITLLRNGQPLQNAEQSDLSFDKTWAFNRLVHAKVVPKANEEYFCRVEHSTLSEPKLVKWASPETLHIPRVLFFKRTIRTKSYQWKEKKNSW